MTIERSIQMVKPFIYKKREAFPAVVSDAYASYHQDIEKVVLLDNQQFTEYVQGHCCILAYKHK